MMPTNFAPFRRDEKSGRRKIAWMFAAAFLIAGPTAAASAQDSNSTALSAQLMELAGTKALLEQMLDQIAPGLTQLVQQANPGKEAEVDEVMNRFVMPKMKQRLPEMIQEGAVVYSKHFSADELSQLIQFYQSPLGRKLVQEQPGMSLELGRIGQAWAQSIAVQAIKEYADEFRKRGLQTPI